jgi:CubicO group peptidase (beta-lactamase class C family)
MLNTSTLFFASLLLLLLPVGTGHGAPAWDPQGPALAARIDATVAPYFKADGPGATLIVVREGKTLLRKAYGMADVAGKVPMRPDATLRLGSLTKQFTAVAIMLLADEGKLATTDPITRFLPDYPTQGRLITVEHLLTHTSGIVSYTGKPDFLSRARRDMSVTQMIEYFKNDPIEFAPGTRYAYNNSGYFLLGVIIEKLSGQPYAKFVEQRIFVPLGMEHTAYESHERALTLRALGHEKTDKGFRLSQPLSMLQPFAAGALVSTVDDLARWDAAITAGKLLTPASWKQVFTAYRLADGKSTNYGYGWDVGSLRGVPSIAHGGNINGFATYAVRIPQEKVYVALLTNSEDGMAAPSMVASKAAAVAIGKPFPDFKAIPITKAALDAVTGTYQIDESTTRVLRREGDRLVMQRSGSAPVGLLPYATDSFFIPESIDSLTFGRDEKGQVNRVTLHDEVGDAVNLRTGPAPAARIAVKLAPSVLDKFVGRYEVAPGFILELTREGDKMFSQSTGAPKYLAMPVSQSTFYVKEYDAELRFENGKSGLTLHEGGQVLPAKRL